MIINFDWLSQPEVINIISMVYKILSILRIVVPIGLIAMTTFDITKKVINPDDKDGQKKIMTRAIAALIVFFIPTLVRLVFKLADIDIDNINGGSTRTPTPTITQKPVVTPKPTQQPVVTPTIDPNSQLVNLLFIDCPGLSKSFHDGDEFTLNTNVESSYTGIVKWNVKTGGNYVSLTNASNKKATVKINNLIYDTKAIIEITSNNKTDTCTINLEYSKLNSVSITNCPDKSLRFNPGDKIILNTDIPIDFKGEIKWFPDDYHNNFIITPSSDKRSATLEVIQSPTSTFSTTTVVAGRQASACLIYVNKSN